MMDNMQKAKKRNDAANRFVEYINTNYYMTMKASKTAVGHDVMITFTNRNTEYVNIDKIISKSHDYLAQKLERNY